MNRALSETETSRLMQNGIEVTEHLGSGTSSEVFAIAPYKGVDNLCIKYYYDYPHKTIQKEYERWIADLEAVISSRNAMTRDEIAEALARTLERREQLLKLMSMNHYDMEANSRMERLTEFKKAYGRSLQAVDGLLRTFAPDLSAQGREEFLYAFFPFIYGIYPYAVVTDKQREAMDRAETGYVYHSIYELAFRCAKKLLEKAL